MRYLLINLLIILNILLSGIPETTNGNWVEMQRKSIEIDYVWNDGFPWCKSKIRLDYSIDEILDVIKNISNYKLVFDSVIYSKEYDNNIVHIILDLPGMFSNRDYVVQFSLLEDTKNKTIIYEFESINEFIEKNQNHVRLNNAGGQWRLKSIANNLTEVTYIWNGEMSGNFPSWGLKRAWVKQGNEVLGNLRNALIKNGDF